MVDKIRNFWLKLLYLLPIIIISVVLLVFRKRLMRIINPLIIAVGLFFILNPLVEKLEHGRRVKRSVAITVVFFIVFVVIFGAGIFIIPIVKENVSEISERLPLVKEEIILMWEKLYEYLNSGDKSFVSKVFRNFFGVDAGNISGGVAMMNAIEGRINKFIFSVVKPKSIFNLLKVVVDILTALVISFYLLKDKEKSGNVVLSVFPYGWREFLIETYVEVERIFKSFISGQLVVALIVGTVETIGLWILGVPYPILLGLVGGISNMIPYFGPFIGAIPAVTVMFFVSPFRSLLVVLLFVIVQQIDNNFISPKIIEGKLGIHPVATILSVFIGGEFFGVPGMLFAVPVYAILKGVCFRIVNLSARRLI